MTPNGPTIHDAHLSLFHLPLPSYFDSEPIAPNFSQLLLVCLAPVGGQPNLT